MELDARENQTSVLYFGVLFSASHEETVNRRFDNEHTIRGDFNGYER